MGVRETDESAKDDASGPEVVRYRHLKEADEKLVKQMIEDYNQSLKTGVIPE